MLGGPWPATGQPLFTPEDTAWALALHEQEQAEAAERCPLCGLPKSVCRDIKNQTRFQAEHERCHATAAIGRARATQGGDDVVREATAWTASLPD